ncbi:MAG: hypothetical protein C0467_01650 [Planctomycetaceae bacterium]|nr:hypothetical protein [Planctomycetaceae bacterium]
MTRFALALAALTLAVGGSRAAEPPVNLTEKVGTDVRTKSDVELELKGELFFAVEGKKESARLEAKARHVFAERLIAVSDGLPSITARAYTEAVASVAVAGDRTNRTLPADRRLVVARRNADGLLCFSPTGALSRDELDLVTEHFNPQCLAGLLPGAPTSIGDTWKVTPSATQAACLLGAVIKAELAGKLTTVKDGIATFTIEGPVEGVEHGAKVSLAVSATGTFDIAAGRVTGLVWKQKDERDQGPVSPASKMEATVTLKREPIAEFPAELSNDAVAKIPEGDVPATMTALRHADVKGRYTLLHSRDWHVTGQTDTHLVLRLLDRGEFVAQATLSVWRKVEPGQHMAADDFKKAIAGAPGWVQTKVVTDGELPMTAGRWLYRLMAEGKMDELPVVQTFYLLAGPQGDQLGVTVAMKPDQVKAVGTRDLDLVKAIEFGKK